MRTIVVTSLLVASLGLGVPVAAGGRELTVDIDDFMTGLACTESSGRYGVINPISGSLGKYQIMPNNWLAWTRRYMGNPWARPTPRNQEFVARERISDLYQKHGDWRLIAHWWRTGNAPKDESTWSDGATNYVNTIMAIAFMAAEKNAEELIPARCFPVDYPDPRIHDWPPPRVLVTGGRVNVRVGPGYENRAIDVVREGMRLAVLAKGMDARGNKWLRIGLSDGRSGWIARWFTKPIE